MSVPLRTNTNDEIDSGNVLVDAPLFSVRAAHICKANGIKTLGQLTRFSPSQLLRLQNLGQGTLTEVQFVLTAHGLSLAPEPAPHAKKSVQRNRQQRLLEIKAELDEALAGWGRYTWSVDPKGRIGIEVKAIPFAPLCALQGEKDRWFVMFRPTKQDWCSYDLKPDAKAMFGNAVLVGSRPTDIAVHARSHATLAIAVKSSIEAFSNRRRG